MKPCLECVDAMCLGIMVMARRSGLESAPLLSYGPERMPMERWELAARIEDRI